VWGCRQDAIHGASVTLSWENIETLQKLYEQTRHMLKCWETDKDLQATLLLETMTTKSTEVTKATAECLSLYEKVQGSEEEMHKMVGMVKQLLEDQNDASMTVREEGVTKREEQVALRERILRDDMQGLLFISRNRKEEEETCVQKDSGASMARTRLFSLGQVYV